MHIEHITLQPHPLETFRQALDALIACAPGSRGDIAAHLYDAAHATGWWDAPLAQPTPLRRRLCEQLLSAMADDAVSERQMDQFALRQSHLVHRALAGDCLRALINAGRIEKAPLGADGDAREMQRLIECVSRLESLIRTGETLRSALVRMADEHWLDVPAHDAAQMEPGRKTA